MLSSTYYQLLQTYTPSIARTETLWHEIERLYNGKSRHYHNLHHLEHLLQQLLEVRPYIQDWDTLLFSLYYHDAVYNPIQRDNEAKSASLAAKRMRSLAVPEEMIEKCGRQILATQAHQSNLESDTNYFIDADLSILGQEWSVYEVYSQQIRKEFAIFPDMLYNPGRAKVLKHFLQMARIFKSEYFFEKLEVQARENLYRELGGLL